MDNTDIITPVKLELRRGINKILNLTDSRIYVNGGGARCALNFAYGAQTDSFALRLNEQKREFTLNGHELVSAVYCKNGHIYFELAESFYTSLLYAINEIADGYDALPIYTIEEHMDAACSPVCPREHLGRQGLLARICYVHRRMWMLSRHAEGSPGCHGVYEIKRALLLTAIMLSYGGKTRILDACDALLKMTHTKNANDRPERAKHAAHAAAAAVKALCIVYNNLIAAE